MPTRNTLPLAALLLAVSLLAAGCGSSKPVGKLTGQVTLNGTPVKGAQVTAYDEKGEVLGRAWVTDGQYAIDNLPPGPVMLSVVTHTPDGQPVNANPRPLGKGEKAVAVPKKDEKGPEVSPVDPVPLKYTSPKQSDLKVTVEVGEKVFDIAMTGKGEIPKGPPLGQPGGPKIPGGPKGGPPGGPPFGPPGGPPIPPK